MYQLECFKTSKGFLSARIHIDDAYTRHIHSSVDPTSEKYLFANVPIFGHCVVLCGTGLGYHLEAIAARLKPETPIILIDYFEELTHYCRTTYFAHHTGPILEINAHTADTFDYASCATTSKSIQIIRHPATCAALPTFYATVCENIAGTQRARTSVNPKKANRPLLLYGNFFLQEEIRRALARATKEEPVCLEYSRFTSGISFEAALQQALFEHKPTYILSVNMKGFDGNGILPAYARRLGIPLVVWFVDDPHPILLHQKQFIDSSLIACCWEKSYIPYLTSCGFSKVYYLPLACDPSLFTVPLHAIQSVHLGFVGTPMSGSFLQAIRNEFMYSKILDPIIDECSKLLYKEPKTNVFAAVQSCAKQYSIALPADQRNITWLSTLIIHTASMLKRRDTIQALIPYGIETFGDPEEWRDLIGKHLKAHTSIDYQSSLCACYATTAINLNITSCQMPTAVNQRVFDVPASGSFLLTDNQPALFELFERDTEVVAYTSIRHLISLIEDFSHHPAQRAKIAAAAHQRIVADHTYDARLTALNQML